MPKTLARADAGVLKAALATILIMSRVIPMERIKAITALCRTDPMTTNEAMPKLARLRINGCRIFDIGITGEPGARSVEVEYLLRGEEVPGGIQTVWRAIYIRLHELADAPLPENDRHRLDRASSADGVTLDRMARSIDMADRPVTVH